AEDVGEKTTFEQLAIGREALLRRQGRVEPVAGGVADGEPARGRGRVVMSHGGCGQRERQRQRVRARLRVELEQPRGHGGHAGGGRRRGGKKRRGQWRGKKGAARAAARRRGVRPPPRRGTAGIRPPPETAGSAPAKVSAPGMTMAPGVVMEGRWMSSISLSRASAQRVARSSAHVPCPCVRIAARNCSRLEPSTVRVLAIKAPTVSMR